MALPYWETDIELELLKAGIKQLVKREAVPAARVAAALKTFRDAGLRAQAVPIPSPRGAYSLAGKSPRGRTATVLVAREDSALRQGAALEASILSDEASQGRRRQAKRSMGELLGYPACCVEAYLSRGDIISMTEYHLAPYVNTAEHCDPLLNPLTFLYFTCSCGCSAASENARAALAISEAASPKAAAKYKSVSAMPVLFWDCGRHLFLDGIFSNGRVTYKSVVTPRLEGAARGGAAARRGAARREAAADFISNAASLIRDGDNLSADIHGVHVRAGDREIGTIPRAQTLYPAAIIDPCAPDPNLSRNSSMAFINFHQPKHDYFLHSISNVLAGNMKELGMSPAVYHFRHDAERPFEPNDFAEKMFQSGARLAVFHRTVMPELVEAMREKGMRAAYIGNMSGAESGLFDFTLEDYTRGKALDMLISIARGWQPLGEYPGPDTKTYFLEGYNPIPDAHVDNGARASYLWHVGPEYMCYYNRSVENNPLFAEIPAEERRLMRGCSYCNCHLSPLPPADAVRIILHHILQTLARVPGVKRFCVTLPMKGLAELVEMLPDSAGGAELWIECRADDVHANRERLEQTAETANAKKIQLVFFLLGIENFSQKELDLFNKNVKVALVEESMDIVEALQEKFPETVLFRQLNTHGFILFNPWTTLEDLKINQEAIIRHRMNELVENPYDKKLRLYANVPLFELARRQGLIPDAAPDAWISRLNYGADEVPWTYRDPAVPAVWELFHLAVPFVETSLEVPLFGLALEDVEKNGPDNVDAARAKNLVNKIQAVKPPLPSARNAPGDAGSSALLQRLADKLPPGAAVGQATVAESRLRSPFLLSVQLSMPNSGELILNVNSRPDAPAYIRAGLFGITIRADEGHMVSFDEDRAARALKQHIQDALGELL